MRRCVMILAACGSAPPSPEPVRRSPPVHAATPVDAPDADQSSDADRDGDRIADARDACPAERGAPHRDPARSGCPGLVTVEGAQLRLASPVRFEIESDRIVPASYPVLDAIGEALLALACTHVEVRGHDGGPSHEERGRRLSLDRARSVARYFVERAGIDAERLAAYGDGGTRPLVPPGSPDAVTTNRRIEVVLVACRGLDKRSMR